MLDRKLYKTVKDYLVVLYRENPRLITKIKKYVKLKSEVEQLKEELELYYGNDLKTLSNTRVVDISETRKKQIINQILKDDKLLKCINFTSLDDLIKKDIIKKDDIVLKEKWSMISDSNFKSSIDEYKNSKK